MSKKLFVAGLNLILITGVLTYLPKPIENNIAMANIIERTQSFLFTNLEGTLPTSSTYININATTNPCGFIFTGNAQRAGSSPNLVLGITSSRSPNAEIIITKPSYVQELLGIELKAYSGAAGVRYLAINGVQDTTPINNSGTYANPLTTGKILISGNSVKITSPNGNILIKEFIVYYY